MQATLKHTVFPLVCWSIWKGFLVADTRLYTLPCWLVGPSFRPSHSFNSERFLHYCSCQTVHDWIAAYPALCSTGVRPLWGRCTASHSNLQPCKAGQWVSLTMYCSWATCKRADSRPERADFRPERADFSLERADFKPERAWGGTNEQTNGQADERMNISPVFYRTSSPLGRLPKNANSNF